MEAPAIENKIKIYGLKSYSWFALKVFSAYAVVRIIVESIFTLATTGTFVFMLGLEFNSNMIILYLVGWFFWRMKFKSQIEEERGYGKVKPFTHPTDAEVKKDNG